MPATDAPIRGRIVDAAVTLFASKGFSATTMDAIAASAGITKRTLYRYVGTKENLLFLVHGQFFDVDLSGALSASTAPVEDRFRNVLQVSIGAAANHPREVRVFFEEFKHLSDAARPKIIMSRDAYQAVLQEILETGVTDGTFGSMDTKLASRIIFGAINQIYLWYRVGGPLTPVDVANFTTDLFLNGAVSPSARGTIPSIHIPDVVWAGSEQPHAAILEAAAMLFATQGYHETSAAEISDVAHVTKGALFYHATSKPSILTSVQDRVMDESLRLQQDAIDACPDPLVQLAGMIAMQVGIISAAHDAIAVAFEEWKYLDEASREAIFTKRREYRSRFQSVVSQCVEAGVVHSSSPWLTTMTIIDTLNATYRWYRPDGPVSPEELYAYVMQLLGHGVRIAMPTTRH